LTAYLPGLFLGFSLIIAIGAQNAFVLRQGLRREHVFAVCLACSLSDAVLIAGGVSGLGFITQHVPWLEPVMRYGGAAFLLAYAVRSALAALRSDGSLLPSPVAASTLQATLATCLAFTWLNPHVYLDTVVLLGSVSTQYAGEKVGFALGAVSASFLFFFALGYGARFLRPLFAKAASWRLLDAAIAITMAMIGLNLLI
jgi:L-lysine exporter family protein LysE/ArgO